MASIFTDNYNLDLYKGDENANLTDQYNDSMHKLDEKIIPPIDKNANDALKNSKTNAEDIVKANQQIQANATTEQSHYDENKNSIATNANIENQHYLDNKNAINKTNQNLDNQIEQVNNKITNNEIYNDNNYVKKNKGSILLIVGDSYADGTETSGGKSTSMANVAANILGLTPKNFAIGGTGFLTGTTFASQLNSAKKDNSFNNDDVRAVVVIGGRNDGGNTGNIINGVDSVVNEFGNNFKNAELFIISGLWDNSIINYDFADKLSKIYTLTYPDYKNKVHIIKGAYTWGFGEGENNFNDIHPKDNLAAKYGNYIADCINTKQPNYYIDKFWRVSGSNSNFSSYSATVALTGGTITASVRAQQNKAGANLGDIATFNNLTKMGIFKTTFGYTDDVSSAPQLKWDGKTFNLNGNIFGPTEAGRVVNATIAYSMLGTI